MLALHIKLTEEHFKTILGLPDEAEVLNIYNTENPWSRDIDIAISGIGLNTPKGCKPPIYSLSLIDHHLMPGNLYKQLQLNSPELKSSLPTVSEIYRPFQDLRVNFEELAEHLVKTIENNQHLTRPSLVGLVASHLRERIS